jgi:hypothetical protein
VPDPRSRLLGLGVLRFVIRRAGVGPATVGRRWTHRATPRPDQVGMRAPVAGSLLRRWVTLPQWRRRLLLESAVELCRASARLVTTRPERVVTLLGPLRSATDPDAPSEATQRVAGEVGSAVTGVANRLPWHPTCLRQAIAARRMLDRRDIPAIVHLGLLDARSLSAHAWVQVGERIVVGGQRSSAFTTVGTFAAAPQPTP